MLNEGLATEALELKSGSYREETIGEMLVSCLLLLRYCLAVEGANELTGYPEIADSESGSRWVCRMYRPKLGLTCGLVYSCI